MTWRDRLQRASFRGVRFFVDGSTGTRGRRVTVQRLAGGTAPVVQDSGSEPREFDVSAYLFGDDYDLARDQLETALSEPGTGALVIPTRGSLTARITRGPSTTESKAQGGYCTLRFSVLIEGDVVSPARTQDTSHQTREAAAAVRTRAREDLVGRTSTEGLTTRQLNRIADVVALGSSAIARTNRLLSSAVAPVTSITRQLDAFTQNAVTLLSTPALFATIVIDLMGTAFAIPDLIVQGAADLAGAPATFVPFFRGRIARQVDRAAAAFRGLGEPYGKKSSALEQQAEENRTAVATMYRALSVASTADAYADLEFDSSTFALQAYGRTLAEIDSIQQAGASDPLCGALDDLRAALGRHVYDTLAELPEAILMQARLPVHVLLIAHQLYGDARYEADITVRNNPRDPNSMQGWFEALRSVPA